MARLGEYASADRDQVGRAGLVFVSALLGVALAACGGADAGGAPANTAGTSGGTAKAGVAAADFTARDIDGKTVRLSDYLGKQVVLIDFWATYCEPCLAEMPHLRKLYEADKAKGFVVLAVAMDGPETVADVPNFAKRNGMVFPVVLDEDSRIASIYNPKKSAPFSVLIDKKGQVVHVHEGYNPGDEAQIAEAVTNVLGGGAAP
jgi:peroxiredoxin